MDKKKIAKCLERITALHGGILRPEDVVQSASDKTSPLHDSFDWDDGDAAHKWRLHQARHLIHSIRVDVQVHLARLARQGMARRGWARLGKAGMAWHGMAGRGWQGKAVMAWHGKAGIKNFSKGLAKRPEISYGYSQSG